MSRAINENPVEDAADPLSVDEHIKSPFAPEFMWLIGLSENSLGDRFFQKAVNEFSRLSRNAHRQTDARLEPIYASQRFMDLSAKIGSILREAYKSRSLPR